MVEGGFVSGLLGGDLAEGVMAEVVGGGVLGQCLVGGGESGGDGLLFIKGHGEVVINVLVVEGNVGWVGVDELLVDRMGIGGEFSLLEQV